MSTWPITMRDVFTARQRLRNYLEPTPLRNYSTLDAAVGAGIRVFVKHENVNPTGSFKARNGLSAMMSLTPDEKKRGVVAATRGNHGQALAWAGSLLKVPVHLCVPVGNNPEKNEAMRGFGAHLIEEGKDYDEAIEVARKLVTNRGFKLIHSTNDNAVIAGAATMTLEILEDAPNIEALVIAVGGGSQAVGALTVARAVRPDMPVYAVQAEQASAIHDAWKTRRPVAVATANTFADGLATRHTYDSTFPALCEGLRGFVVVSEAEIASAIRMLLSTTHHLAEGAGAAGLAGLIKLRPELSGKTVGIILCGANIDRETLRRVINKEL
jgi:threonine dehydratase